MHTEGITAGQKREKMKEIVLLLALGILLPTTDTYSDLSLAYGYYAKGHPRHCTLMLIPFLVNYLLTWFAWWRMPHKNRHITWIFVALSCFPQYRAAVVIWHLCWNLEKGLAKKRIYEREISEVEIFTEAVPTALLLTFWLFTAQVDCSQYIRQVISLGDNTFYTSNDVCPTSILIFGPTHDDLIKFLFTFAISILSASLGLAKCLKVGPCRVLGEGGALGGLCAPRFILLVLAMGFTLVGKGSSIALAIIFIWSSW